MWSKEWLGSYKNDSYYSENNVNQPPLKGVSVLGPVHPSVKETATLQKKVTLIISKCVL